MIFDHWLTVVDDVRTRIAQKDPDFMLRLQNIRQLFKMHGIDTGEKEEEKQRKKMERAARKKQKLRESVEEILREERLRRGRDDSG